MGLIFHCEIAFTFLHLVGRQNLKNFRISCNQKGLIKFKSSKCLVLKLIS